MSKVDHPDHYNKGKIEVIDAIEDWELGFNLGNVVKYLARAEHKHNLIEDLEKAAWYLYREIQRRKSEMEEPISIGTIPDTGNISTRNNSSFPSSWTVEVKDRAEWDKLRYVLDDAGLVWTTGKSLAVENIVYEFPSLICKDYEGFPDISYNPYYDKGDYNINVTVDQLMEHYGKAK